MIFNLTLGTSLESSDSFAELFVIIEVGSEGTCEVVEFSLVFLADFGEGNNGGVLLVDEASEGRLSLDETVWDVEFSAEVG